MLRFLIAASLALPAVGQGIEHWFRLGVAYSQKNEHDKARDAFLRALDLAPDSLPILNNLGVNALERRDEAQAESYFRRVLELQPADADAAFNLGLLELKRKNFAAAESYLGRAASARPKDLAILHGQLEARMGLGRGEAVNESARRILQLAPHELAFYAQLASPLADRGFPEAAAIVLEQARNLWPNSPEILRNLAVAYWLAGKADPARRAAEAALASGDRADLRHLLGDVYEKLGAYDKAVASYQAAVGIDPAREEYQFSLGYEFLLHHNFDLAERVLGAAVARLPRAVKLRLGLAAAHIGQAKYTDAVQALVAAVDADPDSILAYQFLARTYLILGDQITPEIAATLPKKFEQYVKIAPQNPLACYVYGASMKDEQYLKKALALDPNLAEAHFELGKMELEARRYREAIAELEAAVRLKPGLVAAHYRLSRAYTQAGDTEKARRAAEEFERRRKEQQAGVVERRKEIVQFLYTLK